MQNITKKWYRQLLSQTLFKWFHADWVSKDSLIKPCMGCLQLKIADKVLALRKEAYNHLT